MLRYSRHLHELHEDNLRLFSVDHFENGVDEQSTTCVVCVRRMVDIRRSAACNDKNLINRLSLRCLHNVNLFFLKNIFLIFSFPVNQFAATYACRFQIRGERSIDLVDYEQTRAKFSQKLRIANFLFCSLHSILLSCLTVSP